MRLNTAESIIPATGWASNGIESETVDMRFAKGASIVANNTVASSAAKTFLDGAVDTDEETITITTHGFVTGRKVALTGAVLPTGLSATDYWTIRVDANTLKLAASAQDAEDGVAVDITDASGGGTHTLTPAALATASLKLQWSNTGLDNEWFDVTGSSQNVTTTGLLGWQYSDQAPFIKVVGVAATGQVSTTITGSIMRFRRP